MERPDSHATKVFVLDTSTKLPHVVAKARFRRGMYYLQLPQEKNKSMAARTLPQLQQNRTSPEIQNKKATRSKTKTLTFKPKPRYTITRGHAALIVKTPPTRSSRPSSTTSHSPTPGSRKRLPPLPLAIQPHTTDNAA